MASCASPGQHFDSEILLLAWRGAPAQWKPWTQHLPQIRPLVFFSGRRPATGLKTGSETFPTGVHLRAHWKLEPCRGTRWWSPGNHFIGRGTGTGTRPRGIDARVLGRSSISRERVGPVLERINSPIFHACVTGSGPFCDAANPANLKPFGPAPALTKILWCWQTLVVSERRPPCEINFCHADHASPKFEHHAP